MLINVGKKIEVAANVAIIVVACLLGTVLVKNYLVTKRTEQASKATANQLILRMCLL